MQRCAALVLGLAIWLGAPSLAGSAPDTSIRPVSRPTQSQSAIQVSRSLPLGLTRSVRPVARAARLADPITPEPRAPGFDRWAHEFRARALSQGIRPAVFDTAFAQVAFLPEIVELDKSQSEFSKQIWDYLDSAVSVARVSAGQRALQETRDTLRAIERRYGVDAEIVAAIWGLESSYGALRGSTDTLSAMASLAFDGRRRAFFETEIIAALRILQSGQVRLAQLRGSWAGAMGHTQFMPTSFLAHAVDGNRNGRKNIWGDDPTDALASTANFLRENGWTCGQPWGMEVRLPRGFDVGQSGERIKKNAAHWNAAGVRLVDGGRIPDHGPSSILLPAGADAAAFVIFDNFQVLETYNPADAYVIGVGHLADRIAGGAALHGSWPRQDRALTRTEKVELQNRLNRAGFPPGKYDGIIGPNTIEAVRRYQASVGAVPDGYANLQLLRRLR